MFRNIPSPRLYSTVHLSLDLSYSLPRYTFKSPSHRIRLPWRSSFRNSDLTRTTQSPCLVFGLTTDLDWLRLYPFSTLVSSLERKDRLSGLKGKRWPDNTSEFQTPVTNIFHWLPYKEHTLQDYQDCTPSQVWNKGVKRSKERVGSLSGSFLSITSFSDSLWNKNSVSD